MFDRVVMKALPGSDSHIAVMQCIQRWVIEPFVIYAVSTHTISAPVSTVIEAKFPKYEIDRCFLETLICTNDKTS